MLGNLSTSTFFIILETKQADGFPSVKKFTPPRDTITMRCQPESGMLGIEQKVSLLATLSFEPEHVNSKH